MKIAGVRGLNFGKIGKKGQLKKLTLFVSFGVVFETLNFLLRIIDGGKGLWPGKVEALRV